MMTGDNRSMRAVLGELWDVSKTVVIAVAVTLTVRFFFVQPFNIPSGSMEPTLLTGDFILVDKIDYGYSKASLIFPLTRLPVEGRVFSDGPERGEVAVFKNKNHRNRDYVKRIIGLPGDRIQVIGGVLHVNGQPIVRETLPDAPNTCEDNNPRAKVYRETLPAGGPSYIVQECDGDRGAADNTAPVTVPEGHYFGMGDNRDRSLDSRSNLVKFIPHDQLVGRATRVAFSVDGDSARFWEVWRWPMAIRYGRVGDKVN
jgi:signal peptidase I